uniref:Uncharacterized protein n=1 Tax=Romanomermis culicivorax TaxID=13658 RepID=A0A915I5W9_ROMCU
MKNPYTSKSNLFLTGSCKKINLSHANMKKNRVSKRKLRNSGGVIESLLHALIQFTNQLG